jgi:DNA-binding transcriptional regulator YiaG
MPNVQQVLREEIRRLARKEARDEVAAVKKDTVRLKRDVAQLKREIEELQRDNRVLRQTLKRVTDAQVPDQDELQNMRITGKMIRKLRDRLKLTQADLAQLMNVSPQSVYQWERKDGSIRMRIATRVALQRVRQMGVREAQAELENTSD